MRGRGLRWRPALAPREADVARAADEYWTKAGCDVTRLSQGRLTRQTPGIPDRYIRHIGWGVRFWAEVKEPTRGWLEETQVRLCEIERAAGGLVFTVRSQVDAERALKTAIERRWGPVAFPSASGTRVQEA